MKHEHYGDYTAQDTLRSESALLTVWAVLREFREDLVLVGGLVPRYLCKQLAGEMQAVTMDVDLGVSLGLSSGQYETTTTRLTKKRVGAPADQHRFSIIVREEARGEPKVLAYIVPQTVTGREPSAQFLVSVEQVEEETHLDFLHDRPDDRERQVEAAVTAEQW